MKIDYTKVQGILNLLKSRIDAHLKFKGEYDKQLAFDFSLFNFFSIGENKISEILAYFLNTTQSHGQSDVFLRSFLEFFQLGEFELTQVENTCEKVITSKRRLDIYIRLTNLTIAVENKIGALDQKNQLKDYANYLEKQSGGQYILFYLNPSGVDPAVRSINKSLKEELLKQRKLKIISYETDLIPLINLWLANCEAENVRYFLKEFRKYIEIKFLNQNPLNMSKELEEIIFSNETEINQLVQEYKSVENEIEIALKGVAKKLDEITPELNDGVKFEKVGVFSWHGTKVYKYSIYCGDNKIWVQYVKRGIHLYSNHYMQEGTDPLFKDILVNLGINNNKKIDYSDSTEKLKEIFLDQVGIANESFKEYDKIIAG